MAKSFLAGGSVLIEVFRKRVMVNQNMKKCNISLNKANSSTGGVEY